MLRLPSRGWLLLTGILAAASLAKGTEIPEFLNIQGKLMASNELVNAQVSIVARIYPSAAGGASLYECSNTVSVVDSCTPAEERT